MHNYTDDSFFGHPPDKWRRHRSQEALLAGLGVTQLFVQPDETPRHAQLMRAYRHGSDSPVVYERFCLARFVTIATVIERYGLASALFVDADVVLFSNVFDLFGSHRSWGFGSWTSFWVRGGWGAGESERAGGGGGGGVAAAFASRCAYAFFPHRNQLKEDASAFADFVATFYTGDVAHDAAQARARGRRRRGVGRKVQRRRPLRHAHLAPQPHPPARAAYPCAPRPRSL